MEHRQKREKKRRSDHHCVRVCECRLIGSGVCGKTRNSGGDDVVDLETLQLQCGTFAKHIHKRLQHSVDYYKRQINVKINVVPKLRTDNSSVLLTLTHFVESFPHK